MYISVVSIGISLVALVISVLSWRKSRVVYEIRQETDKNGIDDINSLLKTGEYTILHVQSDPSNVLRKIYILGKIPRAQRWF